MTYMMAVNGSLNLMQSQLLINITAAFVQQALKEAEGGHDWWHIFRVWNNAKLIGRKEQLADMLVVELAALLHDIADSKFHYGDEELGPKTAVEFLHRLHVAESTVIHVQEIIRNISFKGGKTSRSFHSIELEIVQDADRLDALGAIGIARAFNYGGFKNRTIFNPDIPADLHLSREAYKNSTAPTINHFYEKLLLLKDLMNTETGKQMALERHRFMEQYLAQFYAEWNGELL